MYKIKKLFISGYLTGVMVDDVTDQAEQVGKVFQFANRSDYVVMSCVKA